MLYTTYFTIKSPFVWQDIVLYQWNLTSFLLVFVNTIAEDATKEDVASQEVLRRLICFVATIQARTQNNTLKSDHSWWPLRESKKARKPFLGYALSITISNQLGLTEDSLAKALNGQSKRVTETSLKNTLPGCFIFRKLGDSKCVAIN